jgi:tartrate-resistant acid phosphatase type 5
MPLLPPIRLAAAGLALLATSLIAVPAASAPAANLAVRVAVIGDYGNGSADEAAVAALVAGWASDFVLTTGDNNYPDGALATIDANIGQFYRSFIYPYAGGYGPGASTNRFFPSLGNHDWKTAHARPYLNYFALPGNERYYDFTWGPLHLFAVDSDPHEPDGIMVTSTQALWLQAGLAGSVQPWNLVYMHHPPFSSNTMHGSTPALQWPYAQWGATAVLAGHDHNYERLVRGGLVYFVNGSGGDDLYPNNSVILGSEMIFAAEHGAMLIEASDAAITFQFVTVTGRVVDSYSLYRSFTATDWLYLPLLSASPN